MITAKTKGFIARKPGYSVAIKYSKDAIKKNLIKFIPNQGKPFEVSVGELIDLLAKHVSTELLTPALMDNKIVKMIKVQRAITLQTSRDIKTGEIINIPFEHMMPIEYAIAEEALGVAKISDKVQTLNNRELLNAKRRVNEEVMRFSQAAYETLLRKYAPKQEETTEDNQESS